MVALISSTARSISSSSSAVLRSSCSSTWAWMVVAKAVWTEVARDLADEIDYGNFKERAERRSHDDRYVDALHAVSGVMERLQRPSR